MKILLLILALFVVGCASSEELNQKMRDYENSIYEQYEAAPGYKSLVRSTYISGARKYLQFSSGHSSQFNANKAAIEKGLEVMKGFPFLVIKEGNKNVERDSFNNFNNAPKLKDFDRSFFLNSEEILNIDFDKVLSKKSGEVLAEIDITKIYWVGNFWKMEIKEIKTKQELIFKEFKNNFVKFEIHEKGKLPINKTVYLSPETNSFFFHESLKFEFISYLENEISYSVSRSSLTEEKNYKAERVKKLKMEENKLKAERYTQRLTDRCEAMGFVEKVNILNCIQKERQHEELMARQKSLIAAEKQRLTLNQPPPEKGFWVQMGEALLEGMEEGFALGMEQRIYESAGINNSYSGGYYSSNPSSINQVNCLEQKINRLERRTGTRVCKDGNCYYEAPKYDFSGIFGQDACIKYK